MQQAVVWIGGDGWVDRGLDRIESMELTWSPSGDDLASVDDARFDLALLEDDADTEGALRALRGRDACPPLLVVCNERAPERERSLLEAGADQILVAARDQAPQAFEATLRRCVERIARARRPRRVGRSHDLVPGVIAHSTAFRATLQAARRAARSSATVLLHGETGSGKEVVARAIHRLGARAKEPFVAINCAAFPDALLESELFGHVRGAFTGADRDKAGLFEEAGRGTLFLDEIGETAAPMQAKLLRALQEREIRPVGSARVRRVEARVVAATHRDLEREAEEGRFRLDLFYRLAVLPIDVPPLRERRPDILPLAEHFLAHHGQREATPGCTVGEAAGERLLAHDWPGNVRELENEMLRVLAHIEPGMVLRPAQLSSRVLGSRAIALRPDDADGTLRARVAAFERILIRDALDRHDGRRARTARALGITREGLHKKMKRLGIE